MAEGLSLKCILEKKVDKPAGLYFVESASENKSYFSIFSRNVCLWPTYNDQLITLFLVPLLRLFNMSVA